MAQLVAHHTGSVGVRGSNPLSSTEKNPRPHGLGFFAGWEPVERFDDSLDDSLFGDASIPCSTTPIKVSI